MSCKKKKVLSAVVGAALLVFLLGLGNEAYANAKNGSVACCMLCHQGQERQLTTIPMDPDTDDAGTNPRNRDSDDNSLADGAEIVGDTNPNDGDSDDDDKSMVVQSECGVRNAE